MLTNIRPVNKGNKIQNQEHRNESPIDLPQHNLLLLVRERSKETRLFRRKTTIVDLLQLYDGSLVQLDVVV